MARSMASEPSSWGAGGACEMEEEGGQVPISGQSWEPLSVGAQPLETALGSGLWGLEHFRNS